MTDISSFIVYLILVIGIIVVFNPFNKDPKEDS